MKLLASVTKNLKKLPNSTTIVCPNSLIGKNSPNKVFKKIIEEVIKQIITPFNPKKFKLKITYTKINTSKKTPQQLPTLKLKPLKMKLH